MESLIEPLFFLFKHVFNLYGVTQIHVKILPQVVMLSKSDPSALHPTVDFWFPSWTCIQLSCEGRVRLLPHTREVQEFWAPSPFDKQEGEMQVVGGAVSDSFLRKFRGIDHFLALESAEYFYLYELGIDLGYQFFFKNIHRDQSM